MAGRSARRAGGLSLMRREEDNAAATGRRTRMEQSLYARPSSSLNSTRTSDPPSVSTTVPTCPRAKPSAGRSISSATTSRSSSGGAALFASNIKTPNRSQTSGWPSPHRTIHSVLTIATRPRRATGTSPRHRLPNASVATSVASAVAAPLSRVSEAIPRPRGQSPARLGTPSPCAAHADAWDPDNTASACGYRTSRPRRAADAPVVTLRRQPLRDRRQPRHPLGRAHRRQRRRGAEMPRRRAAARPPGSPR